MAISSLGPNPLVNDLFKQRRDAMKAMEQAVQSGNMAGAQQDFSLARQATQSLQAIAPSSSSTPPSGTLSTDMGNLTSAVQSGDLSAAQAALSQYKSDKTAAAASTASAGNSFAADLQSLLAAAQSNDPAAALKAAQALQTDLAGSQTSATHHAHHHHGHHGGHHVDADDSALTAQTTTTATGSSSDTGTPDALTLTQLLAQMRGAGGTQS